MIKALIQKLNDLKITQTRGEWDRIFRRLYNFRIKYGKTLGEKRIRTSFNISGSDAVAKIKNKTAELIDDLQAIKMKK